MTMLLTKNPSAKNCCCFFIFFPLFFSFFHPTHPPHKNIAPCYHSQLMKVSHKPMWAKRWRILSCRVSVPSRRVQFVDSKVWRCRITTWLPWSRFCKRGWRKPRRKQRTSGEIPMRLASCHMARRKGRRSSEMEVFRCFCFICSCCGHSISHEWLRSQFFHKN